VFDFQRARLIPQMIIEYVLTRAPKYLGMMFPQTARVVNAVAWLAPSAEVMAGNTGFHAEEAGFTCFTQRGLVPLP
jgi:hypothetical protein